MKTAVFAVEAGHARQDPNLATVGPGAFTHGSGSAPLLDAGVRVPPAGDGPAHEPQLHALAPGGPQPNQDGGDGNDHRHRDGRSVEGCQERGITEVGQLPPPRTEFPRDLDGLGPANQ